MLKGCKFTLKKILNNKIIVILGGAGFIGSHLIDYLIKQTEYLVISIGRGDLGVFNDRVTHYNESISKGSLERFIPANFSVLAIVNCAGGGNVQASHYDPLGDFYKTTCCTAEVLDYIRCNNQATKFIQLSSAAVYGNCFKLPIDTFAALKPISAYGYNNLLAEKLVDFYADVYGVSASVVRIFSVYGPGLKKQILWDACEKMKKGDSSFFGTGQEIRDFINIHDLVAVLYNAIQLASNAVPVFNCGSGIGISIKELLTKVKSYFPNVKQLHFSGEPKIGDPLGYIADITCSPVRPSVSIDDGVEDYINWYKREN